MRSMVQPWFVAAVFAVAALAVACAGSANLPAASNPSPPVVAIPATPNGPTPAKPSGQTPAPGKIAKVDLEKIFPPPKEKRDLVLNTCTNCHTFVPIVILRMDKGLWEQNKKNHRAYITALSEKDWDGLYEYLTVNFTPDRPIPELPKELLETWTSY